MISSHDAIAPSESLGGLFMIGLPGLSLDPSTEDLIRRWGVSNFILFKRNVQSPNQLRALCAAIASVCMEAGTGAPLIAIDQEGGTVARLPPPFTQFEDARKIAAPPEGDRKLSEYARTCAEELCSMGINMNLAPVLDVCPDRAGFVMERRCLGNDPSEVARQGVLVITEFQNNRVAACAKHFPGLGCVVLDPHHDLPRETRSSGEIRSVDLVPFRAAVEAGVAAIMTSHTIYTAFDEHIPATMSKAILNDLLRTELKYKGVIITDDLEMGAIEKKGSIEEAALRAFQAGADCLLICHDHDKVRRTLRLFLEAKERREITGERLTESLERVRYLRERFCIPISPFP